MPLEIGIGLHWDAWNYAELIRLIESIEHWGYESIWVTNEKFYRDMLVTATVVSEHTIKPQIATFVADPYSQHPALIAVAIATLDEVSHGRAILCLGAGGTGFPVMGIERNKPAQAMREAIAIVRGLLQGTTVDIHGQVFICKHGKLGFVTRPNLPIIIATRGEQILQVAGEMADGVMIATYAEPLGVQHALTMIEQGARKVGRRLSDLSIISRVDTCISRDRREAVNILKPMVGILLWTSYPDRKFVTNVGLEVPLELEKLIARRDYDLVLANSHLVPDSFVEKFCWAGNAEDVALKVAKVASIGINRITILPHGADKESVVGTIKEFALSVKPIVDAINCS